MKHPRFSYTIQSHRNSNNIGYGTAGSDLLKLAEVGLLDQKKVLAPVRMVCSPKESRRGQVTTRVHSDCCWSGSGRMRFRNAKKYGWSGEQIGRLREAADPIDQGVTKKSCSFCISARLMLELALNTGLREGELFAVEGCRFDEQNHTCKVLRQASRYTRGLTTTKIGSARTTCVLPNYWPFHPPGRQGLLLAGPDGKVYPPGK